MVKFGGWPALGMAVVLFLACAQFEKAAESMIEAEMIVAPEPAEPTVVGPREQDLTPAGVLALADAAHRVRACEFIRAAG